MIANVVLKQVMVRSLLRGAHAVLCPGSLIPFAPIPETSMFFWRHGSDRISAESPGTWRTLAAFRSEWCWRPEFATAIMIVLGCLVGMWAASYMNRTGAHDQAHRDRRGYQLWISYLPIYSTTLP